MKEKNLKLNAVLNVIKTLSSVIFPLITFPYISRILMPDNVGKINFAKSFVSYFSLIASLGITTYAIRECSAVRNDKTKLNNTASQIFSINIFTTIISYVLLIIFLFFFKEVSNYKLLIIIQSTIIIFTTMGCDWINSAMEDFPYITIRTVAFQIIAMILMFMFVNDPDDYYIYAIISIISTSGANILNVFYRRKYCNIIFTTQINWKKHIKPIMFLFVMILSQNIFHSADVTMLGLMHGDFEVGLYSTAVKIENIISQVLSSLVWVLMPRMSAYFAEKDYTKINKLLSEVFSVFIILGLPCALGVCLLSKDIIILVAGIEYINAYTVLQILMLSFLFSLVGGSFLGNIVMLPSNQEKKYMYVCSVAAFINIIVNYLLIPHLSINGAAIATALSSFIIMVLLIILVDKQIRLVNIFKNLRDSIIGCFGIFFGCLIILNYIDALVLRIILCVLISIIVYAVILLIFKNSVALQIIDMIKKKFTRRHS